MKKKLKPKPIDMTPLRMAINSLEAVIKRLKRCSLPPSMLDDDDDAENI